MSTNKISISKLPDSLVITIFAQVDDKCLIKFHSACRYLDSFIDAHRKEIAEQRKYRSTLHVVVSKDKFTFLRFNPAINIGRQLSAIRFPFLAIKFIEDSTNSSNSRTLNELLSSLESHHLTIHQVHFEGAYPAMPEILDFILSVNARGISFNKAEKAVSLDNIFGHAVAEKILSLHILRCEIEENFNMKTVFHGMRKLKEVSFTLLKKRSDIVFDILRGLLEEFKTHSGPFPLVTMALKICEDINHFIPGMQIIYKCRYYELFLFSFPSVLVVLDSRPFLVTYSMQLIRLQCVEKSKSALRHTIEEMTREEADDGIFDHICKMVDLV